MRGFASDNNSGVHPQVMRALQEANVEHVIGYGEDAYTRRAIEAFQKLLGNDIEIFFVFGGTAANVLSLNAMTSSYHSILCAQMSHLNVDECGAPEKHIGCKLLPVRCDDGKLQVKDLEGFLDVLGVEHHSQPRVVCIAQATEVGTVYTAAEVRALADFARAHGLYLYMDGARIANAAASLGQDVRAFTKDAGVDVLTFGGTKNGMMYGEAVIFFNRGLAKDFKFIRKQGMQMASKMRFISAQFSALLGDALWLKNAQNANTMAQILAEGVSQVPGVTITRPVESNAVFATLPVEACEKLLESYFFYPWTPEINEVRWMTSFDTTKEDISGFLEKLKEAMSR